MTDALPEPDRIANAPHPRHTQALFGHEDAEAAFLEAYTSQRQHHAWLLTGPRGIGKATFAWRVARFLLTNTESVPNALEGDPNHPALARLEALSEPNLFLLRRSWDDKAKRLKAEIAVDDVRKLHRFFGLSSADQSHRVVIIDAADEMNRAAANALLKLLEEPPAACTLLLVSHQPAKLLPTIKSRCRTLTFKPLADEALSRAITATGHNAEMPPAVAVLAQGSVGSALELTEAGGPELYADLIQLWSGGPLNRAAAIAFSNGMAGAAARPRFTLFLALLDHFFLRLSRTGLLGAPVQEAAQGEAQLFSRLAPHDHAAHRWAELGAKELARLRHGYAVNLDPSALVLDTLHAIDDAGRRP